MKYAKWNNEFTVNATTKKVHLIFESDTTTRRDCWVWLWNNERLQLSNKQWCESKIGYKLKPIE